MSFVRLRGSSINKCTNYLYELIIINHLRAYTIDYQVLEECYKRVYNQITHKHMNDDICFLKSFIGDPNF